MLKASMLFPLSFKEANRIRLVGIGSYIVA